MASSFYRRASWFSSYSPGLASDILMEKWKKEKVYLFTDEDQEEVFD